jgi:hypothetical protein
MADKPILESRGLSLIRLTPELVNSFVPNLSGENVKEFAEVYREDPKLALKAVAASKKAHSFAVMKGEEPLAITGVVDLHGEGLIWAVFSNELRRGFVSFARASLDLMAFYNRQFPTLICDVWAQNEMIIQWLCYLGFDPDFAFEHNGHEMIRFVRSCPDNKSVVTSGQRPVIH